MANLHGASFSYPEKKEECFPGQIDGRVDCEGSKGPTSGGVDVSDTGLDEGREGGEKER